MKNTLFLVAILMFNVQVKPQNDAYPKGLYMNFQEVVEKSPSQHYDVELEERTKGKIKMNGGNDYQLNTITDNVKKKFLKRDVYAYSDGTDLYINCLKYELQLWYSKIEGENEKYFLFKAGIPMFPKDYGMKNTDISYMFGLIGAFSAAKKALIRLPYLLNKESQEVILVSEKNITEVIGSSLELAMEFDKETEKEDVEVLSKYLLKWINE
ncbi:MAG: DUF6563 family protein [Chitinophagales bacterium]